MTAVFSGLICTQPSPTFDDNSVLAWFIGIDSSTRSMLSLLIWIDWNMFLLSSFSLAGTCTQMFDLLIVQGVR